MTRYLLDTNVISDAVRNPGGAVDAALRQHGNDEIGTSIVVRGEILFGLNRNANVKGRQRLDMFLQAINVWALESPVDEIYGDIRASMERQGEPMSANDLWIAAHSLTLDATLITGDQAFSMVPGLKVENWMRQ
jgi:tRNA(fMet)-specific endonuclease VapC